MAISLGIDPIFRQTQMVVKIKDGLLENDRVIEYVE